MLSHAASSQKIKMKEGKVEWTPQTFLNGKLGVLLIDRGTGTLDPHFLGVCIGVWFVLCSVPSCSCRSFHLPYLMAVCCSLWCWLGFYRNLQQLSSVFTEPSLNLIALLFGPRSFPKFTWWLWAPDIVGHYNKPCFHLFSWLSTSRSYTVLSTAIPAYSVYFVTPFGSPYPSHFLSSSSSLHSSSFWVQSDPGGASKNACPKRLEPCPLRCAAYVGRPMCGLLARSMWGGLCGWPMWLRLLRPMIATLLLFLGCSSNTAHPVLSTNILHAHYPPTNSLLC